MYGSIEYSVCHEVNYDNGEKCWVKYGATIEPNAADSPGQAQELIIEVHRQVAQAIPQAIEAARKITSP